jgi:hypothetical protein
LTRSRISCPKCGGYRRTHMYLCTCEREAENGSQSRRFRRPFHRTPTHASGRFNLFLGPRRQACKVSLSLHGRPWVTFSTHSPSPPLPERPILGSSSSVPKMDLSRSTLRVMAGGIYRMLFLSGFRPPSLSLGVYSLFSRIHVSSHGRTTIAIPACVFPPTLDDSRFPRRDVDGTREISCR